MSFRTEFQFKPLVRENPAPVAEKANLLLPKTPADSFANKRHEARFTGDNLRFRLNRQFDNRTAPFIPNGVDYAPRKTDKLPADLPPTASSLTGEELEKQKTEQAARRLELETRRAVNDEILKSKDTSLWEKGKAFFDNIKVKNELDRLAVEQKITDENLPAIARGDKRAIAFFEAMNQTNATGDPWDMNPGDAFRNSLNPEAQKVYDETLARLRNDPRIQFEFGPGTVDNLAFREIALRGMVAATFGRPQDLEARIAQAAAKSENGKFTITFRPDNYVGPDGKTGWGARADRDGIEAKQGFTIQQIANENDNLFIHEFSHTLQRNADNTSNNLPPDFGFINAARFQLAFNTPEFQKYIGQTKIDAETFAGIQNRFRQNPQGLKDVSPEMYQLMVDYSGFDPLTGSLR